MRKSVSFQLSSGNVLKPATKIVALAFLSGILLGACSSEPAVPKPAVYVSSCEPCHGTGGGGAPITGDREEWDRRLVKGRNKVDENAVEGFEGGMGVMPAKGARPDLSDEEIIEIVDYMLAVSQ